MYLIAINGNLGSSQVTEISPLAFQSFHEATLLAEIVLSDQKVKIQEVLTQHSIHTPLTIEVAICLATPTPNGIAISQIDSLTHTINPNGIAMKPTISLYHISGIPPAQYRNDPAARGIAFASHARTKQQKEPKKSSDSVLCERSITTYYTPKCPKWIGLSALSVLSIHSFVRLIHPIGGFNLGGVYLIYRQNAKDNTYSLSPIDEPTIPRWVIEPIDIYPGLELELKRQDNDLPIKPGIHKVRSVSIDNARCNIAITDGEDWLYISDGDLYLPAQDSQGA